MCRLLLAVAATATALLVIPTWGGAARFGSQPTAEGRALCGVERWTVKTLQDRPRLLPVRNASIAYLVSRPAPPTLPATRLPFERGVFRVTAAVTLVRGEADGDLHAVLSDGKRTMIAEAPTLACTTNATLLRRRQMASARKKVRVCDKAVVIGVAFFDFWHGQTGVARNAIELHPILSFTCATATPSPPLPPPAPPPPPPPANCAPSYPDVCIPPPPPDLNCADIPYRNFRVIYTVPDPDPHHFDGDHDGIGCES